MQRLQTNEIIRASSAARHNQRDVLAEPPRRKISLSDVLRELPPNAKKARKVFVELFNGPITSKTSCFKDDGDVKTTIAYMNAAFRKRHGTNAIIRDYINGNNGMWSIRLDPRIFDVPDKRGFIAGKTVALEDVFSPVQVRILRKLAENNNSTRDELIRAGERPIRVDNALCGNSINRDFKQRSKMLDNEVPLPIKVTNTRPSRYSIDPMFANVFGIKLQARKLKLEGLFTKRECALIELVSTVDGIRPGEICRQMGIISQVFNTMRKRINRVCEENNLPPALVAKGTNRNARVHISEEFLLVFGKVGSEKKTLEAHFTKKQREVLEYIRRNPLCNAEEIAGANGKNKHDTYRLAKRIGGIFGKLQEDENTGLLLVAVGTRKTRYALTREGCKMFGLAYVAPDPLKLFDTKLQRKLYQHLVKYPDQKIALTAKALSMSESTIKQFKSRMNQKLRAAGLEELGSKRGKIDGVLKRKALEVRKKRGYWSANALERIGKTWSRIRNAIERNGGAKETIQAVRQHLTAKENMEIISEDILLIKKWDLSGFEPEAEDALWVDEERDRRERAVWEGTNSVQDEPLKFGPEDVRKACIGAAQRGIERAKIERIIDAETDAARAIRKINQLEVKGKTNYKK